MIKYWLIFAVLILIMIMIRSVRFVLLLSAIAVFSTLHGQVDLLRLKEDSLAGLLKEIKKSDSDSGRLTLNALFRQSFNRALLLDGSFNYPFDSLKSISRLKSPDRKFRMITWNLPLADGTHLYFGFIQINPKEKPKQSLYQLTDRSADISDPGSALSDNHSWYGCLYYEIIKVTHKGEEYYTLLGWDRINPDISQKLIEILTVDPREGIRFGAKIFRNYGDNQSARIFFNYSSYATMLLTYDRQYLTTGRDWNAKKKQFETEKVQTDMIVCDDLVPVSEQFEGMYEYYVPGSEAFHGFVFQDGVWTFHRNVDVRNSDK